jgi:hypothetical protein
VISWSPAPLEIDSKLGAATWFASSFASRQPWL